MIISWLEWILVMVFILLSVAFITLYERKILGLTQNRLGPNKTVIKGILQPLLDALKLLTKPFFLLKHNFNFIYLISAMLAFLISLMFWISLPLPVFHEITYVVLWLLFLFGLGTYSLLLAGWSSNSKFSMIGSWRSLSQAISYEVILALLILLPFLINVMMSKNYYFHFSLMVFFLTWLMVMLTETQRAPFDLSEGESELVSGFNTEYSGTLFTFLFLGEYGSILALSNISSLIWWSWNSSVFIWFTLWMWIRTCFPRIRYDKIMTFFWKIMLPFLIFSWLMVIPINWWS